MSLRESSSSLPQVMPAKVFSTHEHSGFNARQLRSHQVHDSEQLSDGQPHARMATFDKALEPNTHAHVELSIQTRHSALQASSLTCVFLVATMGIRGLKWVWPS